jgi:hypothetical protein
MKPRVFISSTYYDLKYLRESLEKFLFNLNFEPVLFEANKVTFEHGKPLDISCFNEVKTCHIMILIIGGRYGSLISEQDSDIEKQIYDTDYISITRKEYETAFKDNIPVFVCIDKNVYGEYNTYKINRDFYDKAVASGNFKFFHVDSVNVFKFIDLVSTKALKTFERIEEIESYLKDQISGMFYLYLETLKSKDRQDEIFDTVSELKNLTSNMNEIIKEVGKKIIEPEKYEEIIENQYNVVLKYFFYDFDQIVESTTPTSQLNDDLISKLTNYFVNVILIKETREAFTWKANSISHAQHRKQRDVIILNLNEKLNEIVEGFQVTFQIVKFVLDYFNNIEPLITTQAKKEAFVDKLHQAIKYSDLPF